MNRKILILLVIVGVIGLFSLLFLSISGSRHKSAVIVIDVVPSKSKITLNGQSAKAGKNKVEPGTVDITASYPGFTYLQQSVSVKQGETKYAGLTLISNDPSTIHWYEQNPDENRKAEKISSKSYDATSEANVKDSPFILALPFVAAGNKYRVDYGSKPSKPDQLLIYITAPDADARQDALTWIRYGGYDISDYKVVFVAKRLDL